MGFLIYKSWGVILSYYKYFFIFYPYMNIKNKTRITNGNQKEKDTKCNRASQ